MTPFAIRNLSVLAYAQGFTLWHYRHEGPLTDTSEPGFFDAAADMMAGGDKLTVSAANGMADFWIAKADLSRVNARKLSQVEGP